MVSTLECKQVRVVWLLTGFVLSLQSCASWQPIPLPSRQGLRRVGRAALLSHPAAASEDAKARDQNIFIVNWDGCLVDTVDWRIRTGLEAAATVWPVEVADEMEAWGDLSWLENKLAALCHVLSSSGDVVSTTCEYALAARMLLEEQQLDKGRSNGKMGKYASKYHPTSASPSASTGASSNGSRPLTVGEIAANWKDMIRETLLVRYQYDSKNPLPKLQATVEEILQRSGHDPLPLVDESVVEALSSPFRTGTLAIVTSHPSDFNMAESSLRSVLHPNSSTKNMSDVSLLHLSRTTVDGLLEAAPEGSTIFVIESSWESLQDHVSLFGDNIPRHGSIGKSKYPKKWLSLCLASWASNSHDSHLLAATMNPWTALIDPVAFTELTSARVVSQP